MKKTCWQCRFGERAEDVMDGPYVICRWGPPSRSGGGVGYRTTTTAFPELSPDDFCHQWESRDGAQVGNE